MNCPNCEGKLIENHKTAQGIKECDTCKGRWFILETTRPRPKEVGFDIDDPKAPWNKK